MKKNKQTNKRYGMQTPEIFRFDLRTSIFQRGALYIEDGVLRESITEYNKQTSKALLYFVTNNCR